MRKAVATALGFAVVSLLTLSAASARAQTSSKPPQDNGKWVGLVAFLVFIAVVGGLLFIANAYRKNDENR